MSLKLFADDYENAGEEALSRLALRGGGEGREGPFFLFCFTFYRVLFSQPLAAVCLCGVSGGRW